MMELTNRIALLQQAESADNDGKQEEALGILARCLDLYPGFSPARVLQGEILARMGRLEEAVAQLDGIIRSNPENIRARILLTRVLVEAGKSSEATTHLDFLGFMMPENDPALVELRELMEGQPSVDVAPQPVSGQAMEPAEKDETDFSDTVTEVLDISDIASPTAVPEGAAEPEPEVAEVGEDESTMQLEMDGLTEIDPAEVVLEEEVVTSHLPDDAAAEGVSPGAGVDIKTRSMAQVYEQQGMYQEALDVLISLQASKPDAALAAEIQRISELLNGGEGEAQHGPDQSREKITVLKEWLEKINAVS